MRFPDGASAIETARPDQHVTVAAGEALELIGAPPDQVKAYRLTGEALADLLANTVVGFLGPTTSAFTAGAPLTLPAESTLTLSAGGTITLGPGATAVVPAGASVEVPAGSDPATVVARNFVQCSGRPVARPTQVRRRHVG